MGLFILFGYYGFSNMGDEQLLDESIKILKKSQPNTPIIIGSGPDPIPFETFKRSNIFKWIALLTKKNQLIFGGGSIFQSVTSRRSLLFYLAIIQIAIIRKTRIILLCHGWGPFQKKWHERLAKKILLHPSIHRSWRDKQSQLNGGVSTDAVFCDLTLTTPLPKTTATLNPQVIGICTQSSTHEQIVNATKKIGKQTLSMACQTSASTHSVDILLRDTWDAPQDIGLLITDRYHCAIWASKFGIPWIAISSDPKLVNLAQQANQPHLNSASSSKLIPQILEQSISTPKRALRDWYHSHAANRPAIETWLNHAISV